MTLTRKDYNLIAGALKEVKGTFPDAIPLDRAIDVIADYLENDNPRFNRDRFLVACS